jgi:hypothetical protein
MNAGERREGDRRNGIKKREKWVRDEDTEEIISRRILKGFFSHKHRGAQ